MVIFKAKPSEAEREILIIHNDNCMLRFNQFINSTKVMKFCRCNKEQIILRYGRSSLSDAKMQFAKPIDNHLQNEWY